MEVVMTHGDYRYRTHRLLSGFSRTAARARPLLVAQYGEQAASLLIADWRSRFGAFIPQIPFIGHNSPFLVFLIPGIRHLALYRALQRRGETLEGAGQLIFRISEAEFLAIPALARRLASALWFSPWFKRRLEKHAIESQKRKYPKGYVLRFVPGDDRTYDYGIDYIECAVCTFLKDQNAFELAPYLCAIDKIASEAMGWGLTRTKTIAEGKPACDFRFTRLGHTNVALPSSLVG